MIKLPKLKSKNVELIYANSIKFLVIIVLILGIFFRFANLDKKVYWGDEVFTSFRIAGYTIQEVIQDVFDNQPKTFKQLQHYQQPNNERNITDTIKSLAIEDSQHPPLYYIIAYYWEKFLGSDLVIRRSLPALISLFVFPFLYLLCLELFASPIMGWIAMAIVAVSPFHVLYAQEVREYSLWTVTILLSSWLLLRAMRLNSKFSWITYAVSLPILLYTYLFSILILIGHVIYVFGIEGWQWSRKKINFLLASSFGLFTFLPWLTIAIANTSTIQDTTSQLKSKISLISLIQIWLFNLSRIFIDLDSQGKILNDPHLEPLGIIIIFSLMLLVAYSTYFICRKTDKKVWLFILTLMGLTAGVLVVPDLVLGGIRSCMPRYLVPCYLGIQLAVTYFIYNLLRNQLNLNKIFYIKIFDKNYIYLGQLIFILLISAGILSCATANQAKSWWNKYGSYYNPQIAEIINQAESPLVVANGSIPRVFSLSYLLERKVHIKFEEEKNTGQTLDNFSDVFLYRPSDRLLSQLKKEKQIKIERVYHSQPIYQYLEPVSQHSKIWLWKLAKS